MKKIKSKHLWRRGATLLLAMLMLFTCVGSALPAFAEEATGNTATVDSGDPVLADSSAGGDSTGDTDADLPDDTPQRPTLPSGEDISEETPPADESDGETVPPADSDSSEEPAAPDSGDSIPDESESEPTEQPGEGDADLPEDEQPGGEEPDPDEDEEIPEDEPEDVPFEALVILDPENGATVQAEVGEEVTFKAPVNREDVAVAYQWQRFQKPAQGSAHTEALYDYAEGETTEYWYALDDMREAEALAMNPDMLWPGIEMYYATVAALDEIGADSSDVSVAWRTPNFALEGYTISAAETEGGIEIYADKDDERHVARLNENNEWAFGAAEEKPATTGVWLNIEGANGPEYTFTVTERDYDASFRCEVTVLDEAYLEQCAAILAEQGVELTEEQRTAEQKLYSVVMSVPYGYTRDGRQSNTRGGHFYHNNRVYDQTSAGIINNIQPEARSGDSGIIPGDTVRFNTTAVYGSYVDKDGKAAIHNSDDTAWYVHAPARYLDLEAEYTLYPCEWCEQYHGFAMGTDHWHITGYETKVNQDAEKGDVLTVATVENLLGETVQNYKLRFVSGTLRVHPKLRFQLKATVPMYVCMYAYNGDGEVVEPTEYGITNYSNGSIRVTDINVDSTGGGFLITDKAPLDLLRGEMSMNMFGTQLVPGANTPANPERWIAAADASGGVDGVFLHLPLECYIASGNVNDETVCTPVAKVQYTIAEYGKTVPEVDDAELPEYIHGEPVTPSTTG